ncbi:MAG: hypothetical protein ACK5Q1_13465, partial [Limnobacter sp.]
MFHRVKGFADICQFVCQLSSQLLLVPQRDTTGNRAFYTGTGTVQVLIDLMLDLERNQRIFTQCAGAVSAMANRLTLEHVGMGLGGT